VETLLLDLGRFPVKDPYGAFLKKDRQFLQSNPLTVRRIADRILALGERRTIQRLEEPAEFNQQIGPLFQAWLRRTFQFVPALAFANRAGLVFLEGTDGEIKNYANVALRCGLDRGIDFVAKHRDHFFIGEAKFITDTGGQQAERLRGVVHRFLRLNRGIATRLLVLDGVPWVNGDNAMHRSLRRQRKVILSAILLAEYFDRL